ncbi:MAG: homocysteine S-methyltransferase family protein [Ardenticatenaceae bacterium]
MGQWRTAGAEIVGGCCDIGPAHIAYLREQLDRIEWRA